MILNIKNIGIILFTLLLLLLPSTSFSKEATGHITAEVVSTNSAAVIDFDSGVVCKGDKCEKMQKQVSTPVICNTGINNRIGKCFVTPRRPTPQSYNPQFADRR